MSADDLLRFRTAYLRIVAVCWADQKERDRIIHLDPAAVKSLFNDYNCQLDSWQGLNVELSGNGPDWNPSLTGGWYGNTMSSLTVRLPLYANQTFSQDAAALALADYYHAKPTLFTRSGARRYHANDQSHVEEGSPVHKETYEEGLGDWNKFLEFGGVMLRALAVAWQDNSFREKLQEDAPSALQSWLGHTSTWAMRISVKTDPNAKWTAGAGAGSTSKWTWHADESAGMGNNTSQNTLRLEIPQRPTPSVAQPIALAAYNNTGPSHPFTCCA